MRHNDDTKVGKKDDQVRERVPSRASDLAIARQSSGEWLVRKMSRQLAQWVKIGDLEVDGRSVQDLFADVSPGLDYLAEEVLRNAQPLHGVAVHFHGSPGQVLLADVRLGGVGEGDGQQQVHFSFGQPPAGRARIHAPAKRFGLVGSSPGMQEVFRKIELYATTDAAVVITGETGSGKELVARALHEQGPRKKEPFVAVNCSAISAELLESELFGHEKGSFTGALRTHRGRFERADRGTIFLDEVGDMPEMAQVKLLRVLEEGSLERIGSERSQKVDVRVIAATNVPLERAVQQGRFRADLYHRLAVLRIHLPPLRQRPDDIPQLVEHFLGQYERKYGRRAERVTHEAMLLLQAYLWPGNVRELRNVLERVYIENRSEVIGARAFREWVNERQDFSPGDWGPDLIDNRSPSLALPYLPSGERLLLSRHEVPVLPEHAAASAVNVRRSTQPARLDIADIRRAYRAADGNLAAAARMLGVHRATLYRHLEKLGLSRDQL